MPAQLEPKSTRYERPRHRANHKNETQDVKNQKDGQEPSESGPSALPTVIGWQGIRFSLPPDWNLTGFSMNRDNGYLRVDAPGEATMTVQVRWLNAAKPVPNGGPPNLYAFAAPVIRKWMRRPEPVAPKPDLRANLERMLKETAKDAKKSKAVFQSTIKAEKTEGVDGERTAVHFAWTGQGRGQGKIWHCKTCNRVVVAQVIGLSAQPKAQAVINVIASRLFANFRDHALDGYDRWALYDLQVDVPEAFHLEEQKLLAGHLHLVWARGGERIILDRWGLANMTLKKFTLAEWFQNQAIVNVKSLTRNEDHTVHGHESVRYSGGLTLMSRLRALRDSKASLKGFPSRYEGGIWTCPASNKIIAVQTLFNRQTVDLWEDVVSRLLCHTSSSSVQAASQANERDYSKTPTGNTEKTLMDEQVEEPADA